MCGQALKEHFMHCYSFLENGQVLTAQCTADTESTTNSTTHASSSCFILVYSSFVMESSPTQDNREAVKLLVLEVFHYLLLVWLASVAVHQSQVWVVLEVSGEWRNHEDKRRMATLAYNVTSIVLLLH